MTIFAPHSIQLLGSPNVVIGGISQVSTPQQNDIIAEAHAGSPFARFVALGSKRPMISFTTRNIAAALDIVGSVALAVKTGGTYTGLELYYAALDECGNIASGSVHHKLAFDFGCLVPRVLSCNATGNAELTMDFMGLSTDGVSSPMTYSGSQALPTLPAEERFTIGPVNLTGAITLDRLQQISVDFANQQTEQQLDSAIYPQYSSKESQIPVVTFTGMGLDDFDGNIPEAGLAIEHASSEIWFRKRKEGTDALEADTALEHVLLTVDGLVSIDDAMNASGFSPGTISGTITCKYDDTNHPVVVATSQQIETV